MGNGCVPWRYVFRLPGIDWQTQHDIAESLRATGMHVSNWYLPAHWFFGWRAGALPGVETLAREVFQFWLDDSIGIEAIRAQATTAKRAIAEMGNPRGRGL